jgi:hypothetical protein
MKSLLRNWIDLYHSGIFKDFLILEWSTYVDHRIWHRVLIYIVVHTPRSIMLVSVVSVKLSPRIIDVVGF